VREQELVNITANNYFTFMNNEYHCNDHAVERETTKRSN